MKSRAKRSRSKYKVIFVTCLIEEDWKITHDPYYLAKDTKWQIDLGAEKMIGAEKEGQKIAVEVKTFLKASFSNEFHTVIGQYVNYLLGLEVVEKDRVLFLAVPSDVYKTISQSYNITTSQFLHKNYITALHFEDYPVFEYADKKIRISIICK